MKLGQLEHSKGLIVCAHKTVMDDAYYLFINGDITLNDYNMMTQLNMETLNEQFKNTINMLGLASNQVMKQYVIKYRKKVDTHIKELMTEFNKNCENIPNINY